MPTVYFPTPPAASHQVELTDDEVLVSATDPQGYVTDCCAESQACRVGNAAIPVEQALGMGRISQALQIFQLAA